MKKKPPRTKRLLVCLTEQEHVDLEVISTLDGFSSKSEMVRQLIRQRKLEMYPDQKEKFDNYLEDA